MDMGRAMKKLPFVLAIVLSLVAMQIIAQRIGDRLLWAFPDSKTLAFTKDPCMELQDRLQTSAPLPPAARMLIQSCVQTRIFEFSASKLSRILPMLADPEYHQRLQQISATDLAIAQYPVLEDRIVQLCAENRFTSSICSSLPLKKY